MHVVQVRFRPLHSCQISIPLKLSQEMLDSPFIVEINHQRNDGFLASLFSSKAISKPKTVYTSWSGATSSEDTIDIDSIWAEGLGFQDGQLVNLSFSTVTQPLCEMAHVQPLTEDDWEILSNNAGYLESQFLNQIGVIYIEETIAIWLHHQIVVRLKVVALDGSVSDAKSMRLAQDSQVVVAPKGRKKTVNDSIEFTGKVFPWDWCEGSKLGNTAFLDSNDMKDIQPLEIIYLEPSIGIRVNELVYIENNDYLELTLPPPQIPKGTYCRVKLRTANQYPIHALILSKASMQAIGVYPNSIIKVKQLISQKEISDAMKKISKKIPYVDRLPLALFGYNETITEAFDYFTRIFTLRRSEMISPPGLMIWGENGSGRSSLAGSICQRLERDLENYVIVVACEQLTEFTVFNLRIRMEGILMACLWHRPCVLVLEDVDILIGEEDEQKGKKRQVLLKLIFDLIDKLEGLEVVIIAISKADLDLKMGNSIHMMAPVKDQRIAILRGLVGEIGEIGTIDKIGGQMDGYSITDVGVLVNLAIQKCRIRNIHSKSPALVDSDFEEALDEYVPFSLVQARSQESTVDWDKVGGMNVTKTILLKTLKWPTKYPHLFSTSPLRLQTGILLYGHPGCGKTMLASSIAKECGLNYISVKGPELLNKYIGASEKAVRDVFNRARTAAPCLLFFDEFESIASRRGSDNSGVTDRVVNQFLTEMDGAEGLVGVYVLGASTRPDLIDPALLRPGRLDKAILCGMPGDEERIDIMLAIMKTISVEEGVSLEMLSKKTEGYSGADLQGMLYAAQVMAVKERLKETEDLEEEEDIYAPAPTSGTVIQGSISPSVMESHLAVLSKNSVGAKVIGKEVPIVVRNEHVLAALEKSRPSVLADERKRLDKIYAVFSGKEALDKSTVGTRTTFAS